MSLLSLALAAASAATAPAAVESTPEVEAHNAYHRRVQQAMRSSSSARERALSTYAFDPDWDSAPAEILAAARGKRLREAAHAAPADAIVQFLWASARERDVACDEGACPGRSRALANLEPENGNAWLPVVAEAHRNKDARAVDAAIASLANATRFDDFFVSGFQSWRDVYQRVPPTPTESANADASLELDDLVLTAAVSHAALLPLNGMSSELARACNRSRQTAANPRRFEDCARAGRLMYRHATSHASQRMGFAVVRVSGLESAADREADRVSTWRELSMARASWTLDEPAEWRQYFRDLESTGSESRAWELLLARMGMPLEPAPDWDAVKGREQLMQELNSKSVEGGLR